MQLDRAYRAVITSFAFVAALFAVLFVAHTIVSLIFWNPIVFAVIFCVVWGLQAYNTWNWDDPEWIDRARIVIRETLEEEQP